MLFSKPFPDELATTHLYRIWAMNDISGPHTLAQSKALAKATRGRRTGHCAHPWTPLYMHQIMAHLSGMTPQAYRAHHTMLALTQNWQRIYSQVPVKESKTRVHAIEQFHRQSAASAYPFRLCRQCRDEDLHGYDMTYWHREHLIAGVDVCPKHQTPLEQMKWQQAYSAPNPVAVQGEPADEALVLASSHPILTRYRDIMLHAIRNPAQIRYTHAHKQLLIRATEMGLCRHQLAHTGRHSYLEHEIPEHLYRQLPRAWMGQHFSAAFLDQGFTPSYTCTDGYHCALKALGHSTQLHPIFLILTLATLFDSTAQIASLLFDQCVGHSGHNDAVVNALDSELEVCSI